MNIVSLLAKEAGDVEWFNAPRSEKTLDKNKSTGINLLIELVIYRLYELIAEAWFIFHSFHNDGVLKTRKQPVWNLTWKVKETKFDLVNRMQKIFPMVVKIVVMHLEIRVRTDEN